MSATTPHAGHDPGTRAGGVRRGVRSFARSTGSLSDVVHPGDDAAWEALLAGRNRRGVTVRGLGASYSDAALNSGGLVATTTGQHTIEEVDEATGTVVVDAGVRLGDLLAVCVPLGWFPPVVPGTAGVTVGGAVAADVHGKNHPVRGSFGAHVAELTLLAPGCGPIVVGPTQDPDAFWATVGGLGLTGVVRRVRLRLRRIGSSRLATRDVACGDLDDVLQAMRAPQDDGEHVVAWLDGHARGAATGRGVVSTARHLDAGDLPPALAGHPLAHRPGPRRRLGVTPPNLVHPPLVRAANAARYARARRQVGERVRDLSQALYPLDAVADWPRLYGRNGLLQYQVVVPDGGEDVLAHVLDALHGAASPPSLVVLKRFGTGTPGHLSFPRPGWTLAVDLPASTAVGLGRCLDDLDDRVLAAGGRVYLVKDSRMRHDLVRPMYPWLDEWRTVRDRLDPAGLMTSDLDRRLWLTGHHGGRD